MTNLFPTWYLRKFTMLLNVGKILRSDTSILIDVQKKYDYFKEKSQEMVSLFITSVRIQ